MKKRLLALIMVLSLALSLVPVGAVDAASGTDGITSDTPNQIVSDGSEVITNDQKVKHSKTITQTRENTFDITLTVKTVEEIEKQTVSEDAAVVLVLDMSNSMTEEDMRAAREAAKNFVNQLVEGASSTAQRQVAIVEFGSNAKTAVPWANANDSSQKDKILSGINSVENGFSYDVYCSETGKHTHEERVWVETADVEYRHLNWGRSGWYCTTCERKVYSEEYTSHWCTQNVEYEEGHVIASKQDGGGTNIEGGLLLANNLLGASSVSGISNKYVVLMTDGVPTYHVNDSDETGDTSFIEGSRGGGDEAEHEDYHDISCVSGGDTGDNLPQQIKNQGAKLYTVSYKNSDQTVDGKTIDKWLASFSTQTITAEDDIFGSLENIAEIIVNQAKAWILTDPMGDYINFGENPSIARVTNANEADSDAVRKFNTDTKTLIWDLKNDITASKEGDWNVYTLTYSITLDNLRDGFIAEKPYDTNKPTSLTYMVTEDGELQPTLYQTNLTVPKVKGLADTITFTKKGSDGGNLAGATFQLTCGNWKRTAISGEDGIVTFTDVPSGHTYTLTETDAPKGYIVSTTQVEVPVNWGEVSYDKFETDGSNNPIFKNEANTGSLTISKTVTKANDSLTPADKDFTFNVTLEDAAGKALTGTYSYTVGDGASQSLVLTDGTGTLTLKAGQTATITGIPVGTDYTVAETQEEDDGFTQTQPTDNGGVATGTITGNSATASFTNHYSVEKVTLDGDDTNGKLLVKKEIDGRDWLEDDSFTFTIAAAQGSPDGTPLPDEATITLTKEASTGGFGDITYTAPGEYTYEVQETQDGTDTGLTYDDTVYTVTVKVEDNGQGKLYIPEEDGVVYKAGGEDYPYSANQGMVFTNTYEASGTLDGETYLKVSKTFNGWADGAEDATFTFTLAGKDGAPMPSNGENKVTLNKDKSTGHFGNIAFDQSNIGKTYTYTITEDKENVGGVTYSQAAYEVEVAVKANGGDLNYDVTMTQVKNDKGEAVNTTATGYTATFTNTFTPATLGGEGADDAITITKNLTGRAWQEGDAFEFTIEGADEATQAAISGGDIELSAEGKLTIGYTAPDSEQNFLQSVASFFTNLLADENEKTYAKEADFGTITFNTAVEEPYTFYITESNDVKEGISYDSTVYRVTVEVTADEDNVLSARVTKIESGTNRDTESWTNVTDSGISFTNIADSSENHKTVETIDEDGTTVISPDGSIAGVGDILEYTIHWVNDAEENGQAVAAEVTITDTIPAGTEYVEDSAANGEYADGKITWTIDAAAGAQGDVTFKVKVTEDAVENANNEITNTATVGVNDASYEVTSNPTYVPEKEDSVEEDGSIGVDDPLTYTISYKNTEDTAATITITDVVPEGTEFVDATAGGTYDEGTNTVTWTLADVEPDAAGTVTMTVQVVSAWEEEVENSASINIGGDKVDITVDTNTETTPIDKADRTITITPADITVYTGGQSYEGVSDTSGEIQSTSGLPEPGYYITLPAWLNETLDINDNPTDSEATDLSSLLKFTYTDENNSNNNRNWPIGLYYMNEDGTSYETEVEIADVSTARYIYKIASDTSGNNGGPVRVQFTEKGVENATPILSDDFTLDLDTLYQEYDMTIYPGLLKQQEVKAQVQEPGFEAATFDVKVDTGTLTVRGTTNGEEFTSVVTDEDQVNPEQNFAVVETDPETQYHVNDSMVSVNPEDVSLLADELVIGDDAEEAQNILKAHIVEEGIADADANYVYQYLDLVDTTNGNAWVTATEAVDVYWKLPASADANDNFQIVHFNGLNRNYDEPTESIIAAEDYQATVYSVANENLSIKTVNGEDYLVFSTDSFSPFVLVYDSNDQANPTVEKTLSLVNGSAYNSGSVSVGDELTYTITVTNTGNLPLSNVTVTDTFSGVGDLTYAPSTEYSVNGDTITIPNLGAGATVTISATYIVQRGDAGKDLTNAAAVKLPGDETPTDEDKTETPVDPITPIRPPVDPDKPELNTEDHYAYIVGYPDGNVKPEGNITRAEVATIFFRLLTDESRDEFWSQTNPYSDVSEDDWYNNAVSTLTNAGIIDGYEDGTFKPNGNITRAEFATIAVRFFEATYEGENLFPDIDGHWAQDYINEAANAGIVDGYPDGTFGPQKLITRAEAMTMVNRTIDRHPHEDHLLDDMIVWPDNPETAWYYEQVQEATNSHEYTMNTDDEQNPYEIWTELLPVRDWAQLEKEWSDAHSGQSGGDVV